jgi:hypothetical protein
MISLSSTAMLEYDLGHLTRMASGESCFPSEGVVTIRRFQGKTPNSLLAKKPNKHGRHSVIRTFCLHILLQNCNREVEQVIRIFRTSPQHTVFDKIML